MTPRERLFGYEHAFDHPVTRWIVAGVVLALVIASLAIWVLGSFGKLSESLKNDLRLRMRSWWILAPAIVIPILLGAFWTILSIGLLSLACYREYARATGLFREKTISLLVVIGILTMYFAVLDHWYGLFVALFPLATALIIIGTIPKDQPRGYIQRVALGVFGFMLFGCALGHLAYFANDALFRPLLLTLFVAVEMNDVFAYLCGKSFGRRKLAPNTSPNKTTGGSIGALVLTSGLIVLIGTFLFAGTALAHWPKLLLLGLIISAVGQLGDLTLSSIKRDLGIKDISNLIPGHGGLLDRFNSMLFVAPAAFHFIGYFVGVGVEEPTRIFTSP
jgi:phosphatidate cytidylyltransferase